MNDQNFEFYLARRRADRPVHGSRPPAVSPSTPPRFHRKRKNRYAFIFPLRPGETQFQVAFHLPYSGQASINPRAIYGAQHFVVMLPKSMQFTAGQGTAFVAMNDPRQSDAVVQVASNTTVGQPLDFSVSGTGTLTDAGR